MEDKETATCLTRRFPAPSEEGRYLNLARSQYPPSSDPMLPKSPHIR